MAVNRYQFTSIYPNGAAQRLNLREAKPFSALILAQQ
jgi:hypothetical protein